MAFLFGAGSSASISLKMNDPNDVKLSRTYSGVLPFTNLDTSISAPEGATNPTAATNVGKLLDNAARSLTSLSRNSYNEGSYSVSQSLDDYS